MCVSVFVWIHRASGCSACLCNRQQLELAVDDDGDMDFSILRADRLSPPDRSLR